MTLNILFILISGTALTLVINAIVLYIQDLIGPS